MSGVWYCPTCGYEVDRGGRCHNCREPLVATDLIELAEGEVDDEVGYRLDGWEDETRGALIEALVEQEIRHRFEGDELVVGGDDEGRVDAIVAEVSGAPFDDDDDGGGRDGGGEVDEATREAVEALYDAADRLRVDPTDMNADGDLAEASAAIFAWDNPSGVDAETWSAIGRVTRRLLGALGAEEALEDDIATQSAILCRLAGPVIDVSDGGGQAIAVRWQDGAGVTAGALAVDDEGFADGEGSEADGGFEGDRLAGADGEALADGEGTADEEAEADDGGDRGDQEELVYGLVDWLPEERAQLDILLDRDGIAHGWEGTDLVVASVDEDRVEALLDEVDRTGGVLVEAPEGSDDEEEYQALSDLFGAADRLSGDPEDKGKRRDLVEAAAEVADWPTPFGLSDEQWWPVRSRVRALQDSIEDGADPDVVAGQAASLSELLRGFL